MSGIFASQFNPVSPYSPVGLDTGTPSIGATLGKKTPKRPPTDEPVRTGGGTPGEAPAAASAAAVGGLSAGAAMGANASVGANKMSLAQAGAASHMSAANQAANGIGYHPDAAPATHIVMPKHSGADATPPNQNSNSGGGFLGWASHIGHDVASVAQNPVVHRVLDFGDPFNSHGISGAVADQSQTNPTIKPSRVYNPEKSPLNEISSGGPKTIQGSVEGNPGVDVAAPGARALPAAYTPQAGFADMMSKMGMNESDFSHVNPTQFSGAARSVPWYDNIPSDISSIGEDALSAL